jgi:hypothetical protein
MESTMNFRFKLRNSGLMTSGLLTGIALATVTTATTAMVGCSREELAPWFPQELRIECQDAPPATVGQPFEWDLMPTGGIEPLTWMAEGLPAGLMIDDGVISGTPTEAGTFDNLRITVTDGDGNVTVFETCGDLVVGEPDRPMIECIDDSGSIPDGFVGVPYTFTVSAPGGVTPYTWEATNLPPGLTLTPDGASATTATISGTPTTKNTYGVDIVVTDANGEQVKATCGDLIISDPISVDTDELLMAFPDGCVPLGVTLKQLQDDGIIFGGDGSPITCELKPGRGNGSGNFDKDPATKDTHPPGLSLNGECAVTGTVSGSLPYGIYAFITTFTQTGLNAYVPYCAPQMEQAPTAYAIIREDTGSEATFKPGVQVLDPDESIAYGSDVPDPQVTVTDDVGACDGNTCFYAFVFAYNTLSSMSTVSANPNSKFPAQGFDGFTHAIRITDPPLDIFRGRAYVTNITFDYCIADNGDDCGNNADPELRGELVRMNGGGSNYYFSLVALPAN